MFDSRLKERVMRLEYDSEQQAKKITDLENKLDQYQKIFGDAILQIAQSFGIETPEIADIRLMTGGGYGIYFILTKSEQGKR